MKKIGKTILKVIQWIAMLIGTPVLVWIIIMSLKSLGPLGEDVSTKDMDFSLDLKKTFIPEGLPNILLILADDLGYADLSCYGSTSISTPVLDKLASQGMKFTSHYAGAAICSPSRAAIMTGRYPIRSGFTNVITPTDIAFSNKFIWNIAQLFNQLGSSDTGADSKYNGLPHREITIAEALKQAGYITGMSGKWHLGDIKSNPEFNPLFHGFDNFLGLNAANDEFPIAIFDQDSMISDNITYEQDYFTSMFSDHAISFIQENNGQPFFYFLSYTAPHQPLVPAKEFKSKSKGGIYGDVVEEMDWHIGQVLNTLDKEGFADNTIVIFTSDNGPWYKGSPGELRGRKGQSYDGGFKVPLIVKWTNYVEAGSTCNSSVMNFDVFPTLLKIAGLENPHDRIIDGRDLSSLLTQQSLQSPHDHLLYFHYEDIEGIRADKWKYFDNVSHYSWPVPIDKKGKFSNTMIEPWVDSQSPNLYNIHLDPGENYDLIDTYPDIGDSLRQVINRLQEQFDTNPQGWINEL